MREQALILVGLLATCIVSLAALARLVAVLRIFRRRRGQYSALPHGYSSSHTNGNSLGAAQASSADGVASSRILLPSLVFHVLVFLCLATEVPVYACRYASTLHRDDDDGGGFCRVGRPLYAVHLTTYPLLFSAFCVIVTLWGEVAVFEPNEWTALINRFGQALVLRVVGLTTKAVVRSV